jgi:hemoglobin
MLKAIGGEAGCRKLSASFYARVPKDPVLRPLFPGKTQKCAIEAFAAFLIQFLEGNEDLTQSRWFLSLRESHCRFVIGAAERQAWLKNMNAALEALPLDDSARTALSQFFDGASSYIVGSDAPLPEHPELCERWARQLTLDDAIDAIAAGRDREALALAPHFQSRPSVFIGLLARMMKSGRAALIDFAVDAVERAPSLIVHRSQSRTLLHHAAAAGCAPMVALLIRLGADPNAQQGEGHTPLYSAANECGSAAGPEIVRALIRAGANVNASGGVTRSTALHLAARRGNIEIARALLECGADASMRDRKGDTPFDRARNCRKAAVAQLLSAYQ